MPAVLESPGASARQEAFAPEAASQLMTANSTGVSAQEIVDAIVRDIGTRTYTRVDYVVQVLNGKVEDPAIYHCYHMCRDLSQSLRQAGVQAWSVMGFADNDGFKQLHPVVVARVDGEFKLFDPAFGILQAVPLFAGTQQTQDGKYRIESEGEAIRLDNLGSKKTFHYTFCDGQESFRTTDNLLVRRNNFPGDAYTMTYRYDAMGKISANVSIFHDDKQNPGQGCVMIMTRDEEGGLVSRKFTAADVLEGRDDYSQRLRQACVCLDRDSDNLASDVRCILSQIRLLREIQARAREQEIARQQSGAPLW